MVKKVIAIILAFCINLPIWFYLLYNILKKINASELMMFLFWIYVPLIEFEGKDE
jgi:hypothetical protein